MATTPIDQLLQLTAPRPADASQARRQAVAPFSGLFQQASVQNGLRRTDAQADSASRTPPRTGADAFSAKNRIDPLGFSADHASSGPSTNASQPNPSLQSARQSEWTTDEGRGEPTATKFDGRGADGDARSHGDVEADATGDVVAPQRTEDEEETNFLVDQVEFSAAAMQAVPLVAAATPAHGDGPHSALAALEDADSALQKSDLIDKQSEEGASPSPGSTGRASSRRRTSSADTEANARQATKSASDAPSPAHAGPAALEDQGADASLPSASTLGNEASRPRSKKDPQARAAPLAQDASATSQANDRSDGDLNVGDQAGGDRGEGPEGELISREGAPESWERTVGERTRREPAEAKRRLGSSAERSVASTSTSHNVAASVETPVVSSPVATTASRPATESGDQRERGVDGSRVAGAPRVTAGDAMPGVGRDETSASSGQRGKLMAPRGIFSQASVESSSPTEHVDRARFVQRVSAAMLRAHLREGNVSVRLSPPDLGSLQIDLSIRQGVLTVAIETETSTARTLLLENLPLLRERLAEQDIRIEKFDVDLNRERGPDEGGAHQRQSSQDRHYQRHGGPPSTMPRPRAPVAPAPGAATTPASMVADAGLDVRI